MLEMLVGGNPLAKVSPDLFADPRNAPPMYYDMIKCIGKSKLLSPEAANIIKDLLKFDPNKRLGSGVNGGKDIRMHCFFTDLDWNKLGQRKITPPYIPSPTSSTKIESDKMNIGFDDMMSNMGPEFRQRDFLSTEENNLFNTW